MDWILLAEDRVQWQTFVNTVLNLRVSKMLEFPFPRRDFAPCSFLQNDSLKMYYTV